MKWSETIFKKKCKEFSLSQDERKTLRKLIVEQKKIGNTISLPPYPVVCSCHKGKCKFQDALYLKDSVEQLYEDCQQQKKIVET